MTPVELVIGCMKSANEGKLLRTKEEIVQAYEKAWADFPMEHWKKMIERLPRIMKQVKRDRGGNRNT